MVKEIGIGILFTVLICLEYVVPIIGICSETIDAQRRAPYQKEYARTAYYLRGSWYTILTKTYLYHGRYGRTPVYEAVELKDLGNGCFKTTHKHIELTKDSYKYYCEWYARATYDYVTAEIKQLME